MYSLQNLQFYTGGGSNTPPVRPPEKKSGQTEGVRACNFCRTSHAACDSYASLLPLLFQHKYK
jgi:hypothetical protein